MMLSTLLLVFSAVSTPGESTSLYREVSLPGESMDEFVLRIAPKAYSTGWVKAKELCGAIITSNGQMSIDMHLGQFNTCEFQMPEGSVAFHTHPVASREQLKFSRQDAIAGGYLVGRNEVLYYVASGSPRRVH